MELLTISDIYSPFGFAVIDPHGDYATSVLSRISPQRVEDVIYFNPSDSEFPIAFNPMEVTDPKLKTQTASELIGVLKRMFDSWGPRLEYILRYSILALLEYPDATMLDITRILTDRKFRADVIKHVSDPVVHNFWTVEFASWNDKFAAEAVAPVLNKVGAFTANPVIRNIIGQPKSSFNVRRIMDERKILIVNLSRGLIGEDNAAILGALMVTKIQLAAMSRADIPTEQRSPFYLYVDEFQNFATDSFATILSEARKYALNLTVANQYVAQMSPDVRDAVFGNVGSMISFRMGADDARSMLRYFDPKFTEYDLVHMHNRHFAINMTIDGEKSPAFSATTLDLPPRNSDLSPQIIERSRQLYALGRSEVEAYVSQHYMPPTKINEYIEEIEGKKKFNKPKRAETPKESAKNETMSQNTVSAPPSKEELTESQVLMSPEFAPEIAPGKITPKPIDKVGELATKAIDLIKGASEEPKKKKRKRTRKRKKTTTDDESLDKTDNPTTAEPVIKPVKENPQPIKKPTKNAQKPATNKVDDGSDEVVIFTR